jgi:hypothetical protein
MKKNEVSVGEVYIAKVSGKLHRVKLVDEAKRTNGQTYWHAVNVDTGRAVTIRSAQRLRKPAMVVVFHKKVLTQHGVFLKDESGSIDRPSVIVLVHKHLGVGAWLMALAQMKTTAGLTMTDENGYHITLLACEVPFESR